MFISRRFSLLLAVIAVLGLGSCIKNKAGCTDEDAMNFNSKVEEDDGTCKYARDAFMATYNMHDSIILITVSYDTNAAQIIDTQLIEQDYVMVVGEDSINRRGMTLSNFMNGYYDGQGSPIKAYDEYGTIRIFGATIWDNLEGTLRLRGEDLVMTATAYDYRSNTYVYSYGERQ